MAGGWRENHGQCQLALPPGSAVEFGMAKMLAGILDESLNCALARNATGQCHDLGHPKYAGTGLDGGITCQAYRTY